MGKLLYFWQGHPKPAFSKKVQSGNQGKFFKNRQKSSPRFKRPQSTLAKMALSSNLNAVKVQRLEKILGQKRGSKSARMVKLSNFRKVTQNPHFLKKCKEGTKEKFRNIAQRVAFV